MKLTKRIVSLVLCAMMLVTLLPAGVFAADTAAMSETSNATHNYLDFEDLTTSSTADDIKAYIGEATPNFVGTKTGATFTASGFTVKEESGNQFVNVGASKSFGIYDEGDFLKDSKFELSFRVRINSATPPDTNPISVARLHYTEDTDSNGRTDFFDMLAITKWDSENGTGVFASSVSSTTATGCGKQVKAGEWYKVCYRIDLVSGDMALYVDDVLLTSTKVTVIHAGIAVDGICFARDYSKSDADLDDIHVRILNDNEAVAAPMPPVVDCTTTTITDANGSKMSWGSSASKVNDPIRGGSCVHIAGEGAIYAQFTYTNKGTLSGTAPFELSFDYMESADAPTVGGAFLELAYDGATVVRRPLYIVKDDNEAEVTFAFGSSKSTSIALFAFPVGEWHRISVIVDPSDDTYGFYLDGKLAAYTTNNGGVYTLYRPWAGTEPISCNISDLKDTFGFEDSTRWPVVPDDTGATSVTSIKLNRAVSTPNYYVDNMTVANRTAQPYQVPEATDFAAVLLERGGTCCDAWTSPASLPVITSAVDIHNGKIGNLLKGKSLVRMGLENSETNYLENSTITVRGKITFTLTDDENDTFTLAAIERLSTDGTVVSLPLGTVDGKGNVDFLGAAGKTALIDGEAYTFVITVNSAEQKATVLVQDTRARDVIRKTVSIDGKLGASIPAVNDPITLFEGTKDTVQYKQYNLASAGVLDTLCLLATDTVGFEVSDLAVETDNVPTASMYGVQTSEEEDYSQSVRLLAGVDSLAYEKVGYQIETWNIADNTWTEVYKNTSNVVFTSVVAGGETVTASELGCEYIFPLVISDVDSSAVLRITPFTVKNGRNIFGEAEVYSVQAKYDYTDYQGTTAVTKTPANTVVVQTDIKLPDFEGYELRELSVFDGSLENTPYIIKDGNGYEYADSNYEQVIGTAKLVNYGGQASYTGDAGLRATVGSKYRQPLDGNKALAFENISGEKATAKGFSGFVKFNTFMPNDTDSYVGKTFKISTYVYVDEPRAWVATGETDDAGNATYHHQPIDAAEITVKLGLITDHGSANRSSYSSNIIVPVGKWSLIEYEFELTQSIIDKMTAKGSVFTTSEGVTVTAPLRPYIQYGLSSGYAGNLYVDGFMVGIKKDMSTEPELCSHDEWEEIARTDALALAEGSVTRECTSCGRTETQTIPATGTIKVLAFGNSFSVDAVTHLQGLMEAAGVKEFVIGNAQIGGCTIDTHWANAQSGENAYSYTKYMASGKTSKKAASFETALTDERWDVITLQQASAYSGIPSSYGNLQNLIDFVLGKALNPNVKLMWHMTWAYQSGSAKLESAGYQNDQMYMYNAILDTVNSEVLTKSEIAGVIPSGTAIQNLRTSYIGDTLTRDGYHMSYDIGRYTVGLTWLVKLTGASVEDLTWVPTDYPNVANDLGAIKEAVMNAIQTPFSVTPSTYDEPDGEDDTVTDSIKVLAIGNSFSSDATAHLQGLMTAAGIKEFVIGNMYIGGCSLNTHWKHAQSGEGAYRYTKYTISETTIVEETSLETALTDEEWDVVTLQQASRDSGDPSTYTNLQNMIDFVLDKALNPDVKIMWHMTWAYQGDYTKDSFANYDYDQMTMYNAIVNAVNSEVLTKEEIVGVIPSGTAIQNLRTSYLGDTLTRDGAHMSNGIGRYTAGLTWLVKLTGASVEDLTWVPTAYPDVANDLGAIKEAVMNAIQTPFSVTESVNYKPSEPEAPETEAPETEAPETEAPETEAPETEAPEIEAPELGTKLPLTLVPGETDSALFQAQGLDLGDYTLLDWEPTYGAFWNSKSSMKLNATSAKFIGSRLIEKAELPVGSIIILDEGYLYRPEAWVEGSTTSSTRAATTANTVTLVDDAWWGEYSYRAFNLSRADGTEMTATDADHLRIYVPSGK